MHQLRLALSSAVLAAGILAASFVMARPDTPSSGVGKGASLPAYNPAHVTGPDKGTSTCPVCKYPKNPAVQVWINTDSEKNVALLAAELEKLSRQYADKKLKVFVVFVNRDRENAETVAGRLKQMGDKLKLEHVALTYLSGPDHAAVKGYGINTAPEVRNTIFVYRDRTVDSKFVNLNADAKGLAALREAIAKVI